MTSPKSPLNQNPSQTNDADYDVLEQDFAESLAYHNRSCCERITQYFGSFFNSKTATPAAELKQVVVNVNPTFIPKGLSNTPA